MISRKAIRLLRRSESHDGRACRVGSTTIQKEAREPIGLTRTWAPESNVTSLIASGLACVCLALPATCKTGVTFYPDVLPILQAHCQGCHRAGEMAPMSFETYEQTRPFATAIRDATSKRTMPPWFADPCCGHFSNDPSLNDGQVKTLAEWADGGAPEGKTEGAVSQGKRTAGWNIDSPDSVLKMPSVKRIPATGDLPYQYIIIPTGFRSDRWVRMSEIRPGNRMVVHHAVAYVREPGSSWLRGAPVG